MRILLFVSLSRKIIQKAAAMPALAGLKAKVRAAMYDASAAQRIEDKIAPLKLDIDAQAPVCVNLLIPEINFRTFFGGYIAKFQLAQKLVDAGFRLRLVLVDPCRMDELAWTKMVAQYAGIENIFERVEVVACADRRQALVVSPHDRIVATTWWTAHIAHAMTQVLDIDKFVYLVQEYESFTFPMGSYYALAHQSYAFPHHALFSSSLLRDYFELRQIGVFDTSMGASGESMAFENAIVEYQAGELLKHRHRGEYKLLFYARPEPHAARNMFEIAYLALSRAIRQGVFDGAKWHFHGIGSGQVDMPLPGGHTLTMLGKFGLSEYRQRLAEYDLGLSLMYTPHPSLLPLEMAAAGMWVVSNSCENKTQDELTRISSNLLAAQPHIEGVTQMLDQAVGRVEDLEARKAGARVNWASNWEQSFDTDTMAGIIKWLKPGQGDRIPPQLKR